MPPIQRSSRAPSIGELIAGCEGEQARRRSQGIGQPKAVGSLTADNSANDERTSHPRRVDLGGNWGDARPRRSTRRKISAACQKGQATV